MFVVRLFATQCSFELIGQQPWWLEEKKRKEKTTTFGVNLMRSQVLYRAAQGWLEQMLEAVSAMTAVCVEECEDRGKQKEHWGATVHP